MASVNKAIIVGNLGADPELRAVGNGHSVCELRVATSDNWTDKQGTAQERTEWHRVLVWGKQGESCSKYLSKGRPVYVEGRIQTRDWEDKEGNKRYTTEIVADKVQFLGGKGSGGTSEGTEAAPTRGKRGTRPSGRGTQKNTKPAVEMPTEDSWDDNDDDMPS